MLSITKIIEFEAAHFIPNHKGKCKNMHGHSYKLEIEVEIKKDNYSPVEGMIMDFGYLKTILVDMLNEAFDHQVLNDTFPLPTAENIVMEIQEYIVKLLPHYINLTRVRLWETSTSYAEWKS